MKAGVGHVQLDVLRVLVEADGLTGADLSRRLGIERNRVYRALRGLVEKGYVKGISYHIEYYGRKGVYLKPVRIYVATEDGKRLLGYPVDYKPVKPLQTRTFISYEEFRDWGMQSNAFYKAFKEAWEPFKSLREAQKARSQA